MADANRLTEELSSYSLATTGTEDILKVRIRNHKNPPSASQAVGCTPSYIVIVDFEATCKPNNGPGTSLSEIIEFPAILIDVKNKTVVDTFHSFCRPTEKNRILHEYCINLTGMTQKVVDGAPLFLDVLRKFEAWLKKHSLVLEGVRNRNMMADVSYDFNIFLHNQMKFSNEAYPGYAKEIINIATIFKKFYFNTELTGPGHGMAGMLQQLGLKFEGRLHSGEDDCKNLARICVQMLKDGAVFRPNTRITPGLPGQRAKPYACRTDVM